VEPAKSRKLWKNAFRPSPACAAAKTPPPQIQWPLTGYIRATSNTLKTMNDMNFTRSATAPETIVAAVPAKTSWKKNLAASGTGVQLIAE